MNSFYGKAHILFDVALDLDRGKVLALLGRNGAGKSTTFKSIMGLVKPCSSQITFQGNRIEHFSTSRICRNGIGYVPEDRRIFTELTVLENLEVGRQPPRDGVPHWTPERLFKIFPNLGEMRNRSGGKMSGGEQQMLTIARTLMGNPSLLLLDEPSEGLSPKIVEDMANAILLLKQEGLAIMISEQNLHFAQLIADHAIILEKGQVRYTGSMDELKADETLQSNFLSA
ncbi:ABC transporter ATP-binding protein [Paraburkholderia aspalathi]|uniref:ABC transporter ATP-binding protein n=1 Tax=Paraburkholderia aspalathi TaxID=1324617 RepID=UPI0038BDA0E6